VNNRGIQDTAYLYHK